MAGSDINVQLCPLQSQRKQKAARLLNNKDKKERMENYLPVGPRIQD